MSTAESGSDIDDPCSPLGRRSSAIPRLAPVHEEVSFLIQCVDNMVVCINPTCSFCLTSFEICFTQVKASSDPVAYFSCDDHFPPAEKTTGSDEGTGHFHDRSLNNENITSVCHEALSSGGEY